MKPFEDLKGKTVVITGSGRRKGIGEAIAYAFAEMGSNIVISDLGQPKGEQFSAEHIGTTEEMNAIVQDCIARGAKAIAVPCDVRIAADCKNLIDKAVETFGSIDVLINNAGVGYLMEPFTEFKESSRMLCWMSISKALSCAASKRLSA